MPDATLLVAQTVGVSLYSYLVCSHIIKELYRGKASMSRSRLNSPSRAYYEDLKTNPQVQRGVEKAPQQT